MEPPSIDQLQFDMLRLRYEDQAECLRDMLKLDIQVFIAFMTVQLLFGGWIADKAPGALWVRLALGAADFAVSWIAFAYFVNSSRRRDESTATIRNINEVLNFNVPGAYAENVIAINPEPIKIAWGYRFRSIFITGACISFGAICLLLCTAVSKRL